MLSVQRVANEFKISTDELIQKSVNLFVQQQLIKVEAELFRYLKKYGIKNVFEMDEKLKNGSLRENDVIDDFFAIDHLESERERLSNLLKESTDD
jgi:sulfur relay (sulfurtransferase) DsrF/TusC family protein